VPEATSAAGAFTLQLGASLSRDDAERQASRLRDKGYAPYIVSAEVPGKGTWYRVRMGSFPTKDAATRYLQDFKRETQAEAFVASTR
jgi:cell division septation protein DedD